MANSSYPQRGQVREAASFHDRRCPSLIPTFSGHVVVMTETCTCGGAKRAFEFRREGGKTT